MKSFFKRITLISTIGLLIWMNTSCNQSKPIDFKVQDGEHIVFIGNTFAERLQHYNYFEALLYKNFPNQNLTVRNLGWSADEINLHVRPFNFGTVDQHLTEQKASVIFASYGLNEAFKGIDSLENFKTELQGFVNHLKSQKYNGKSTPQIILVSPIAHEALGGYLPNPSEHNKNLKLYRSAMQDVAAELNVGFINLYDFTKDLGDAKDSITINGIHLNDKGYKAVSEYMAKMLNFKIQQWQENDEYQNFKKAIDHKNQQFFHKYRAVNGEYIYGSRKEPWVQPAGGPVYYPSEFLKLDSMIASLDSLVWKAAAPGTPTNLEAINKVLFSGMNKQASMSVNKLPIPLDEQFKVHEGYQIELFASEKDFPIEKPVKITFDPAGKCWVSTMPSYPHYYPGIPPNDKIIILEDTDQDGKADKHTVFADSLYMPLGFELGNGGVYVSQPPYLMFFKDTDGDNKADVKEIILHGFGTEDVHHSVNALTWGQDGALYMHMGTFLHTQIETPYGPQRGAYGETWRYDPLSMKMEPYVSYAYANPWGNVFTKDGTHLIGDVSTGMNYFAPPLTVATDYPIKHVAMKDFLTNKIKPKTCGMEIISSKNFPANVQGNILFNTFLGFQGVTQHTLKDEGSGIVGHEIEPLLQSIDPQFRPVDLQFGPDGGLYLVDWFNIVINHGERTLRDPERDKTHGRIWKITYKSNELSKAVDMTKLTIPQLLDQLKDAEDRVRYRARIQLSNLPKSDILDALTDWIKNLDSKDSNYEYQLLEGLWTYQRLKEPNQKIMEQLMASKDPLIRAAAVKSLFYSQDQIQRVQDKLIPFVQDPSPRVRLEAIVSLSHFEDEKTLNALLKAMDSPIDDYIGYALRESFKHLKPVWMNLFQKDPEFLANEPQKVDMMLSPVATAKALELPGFFHHDPLAGQYTMQPLSEKEYEILAKSKAVMDFKKRIQQPEAAPQESVAANGNTINLKIGTVLGKMAYDQTVIKLKAGSQISMHFHNPDEMAHNLVIVKPGAAEKVGTAADAMASMKDAYEKQFIPDLPEVLFATPLVARDETFVLEFTVPTQKGEYPFICTFPGHWRVMQGKFIVE
ncbi:PVC-type heme-binding CxxCH protein [Sphingobacterium sp. HJSM2_6]|uniref:PVC-type heme-binding CxxCH protein n=1 Tax=Sphingobacterium sp. HJSM2_6 TaxID=3366264 RepID=UPI003BC0120E